MNAILTMKLIQAAKPFDARKSEVESTVRSYCRCQNFTEAETARCISQATSQLPNNTIKHCVAAGIAKANQIKDERK